MVHLAHHSPRAGNEIYLLGRNDITGRGSVEMALPVILFVLVGILSACHSPSSPALGPYPPEGPALRILLVDCRHKTTITLSVSGAFQILARQTRQPLLQGKELPASRVEINSSQEMVLAGKPLSVSEIVVKPEQDSCLLVEGRAYRGELHLFSEQAGRLSAVNIVPLEKYLIGVLGAEMPLDWSDAALQAQAIASRTYALYEWQTNHRHPFFELYDSVFSQVYRGCAAETPRAQEIVESTRGVVMLYDNRVFKAFFHSTCGGATANAADVFSITSPSPLLGRPCAYCKDSRYFSWKICLSHELICQALQRLNIAAPIRGLEAGKVDAGQRLLTLKVHHGPEQITEISASSFRLAIGAGKDGLLSTKFVMNDASPSLEFVGQGWGHGVGLCQTGAEGMAKAQFSAEDILHAYYTGIQIVRWWKS